MSNYGSLASSGVTSGAHQIFWRERRSAEICAAKYQGTVEQVDDGWLVKLPARTNADDDPIIQIIKRAIAEAG